MVRSLPQGKTLATPNRIRNIRIAQGLTLEAVAKRVGTTNQQVSHLELGRRRLTDDWLQRLSRALSCHPMDLLGVKLPPPRVREKQLLDLFRSLPPGRQQSVISQMTSHAAHLPSTRRNADKTSRKRPGRRSR